MTTQMRLSSLMLMLFAIHSFAQVLVVNRGVPGENTAEIDARTVKELSAVSPDVVILFAGMNDAVNEKKFLPPEASRLHIENIIDACKKAHARIVLVTVHDPDMVRLMQRHKLEAYGTRSPEQRISDLNKVIVESGEQHRVPVVDFHNLLAARGGATTLWSTDGVHLTAKGYHLLASAIFEQIRKMHDVRTVLCLGDSLTFGVGVRGIGAPEPLDTYPRQLARLIDNSSR